MGLPGNVNTTSRIRELHEKESARAIAKRLKIPRSTVGFHLRRAGARYRSAQGVPYALTAAQKNTRVRLAEQLLDHLRDKKRWPTTVTGDGSWLSLQTNQRMQWVFPGEHRPVHATKQISDKKIMLTVFFSTRGFHCVAFLDDGRTIDTDYCISRFEEVDRSLNGCNFFLHMDNARHHHANRAKTWLEEHGATIMQHPPYSPDLAPSDFWLFGFLKGKLSGKSYSTRDELEAAVVGILHTLKPSDFRRVYNEWIRRLELCIESGGEYVHITQ